MKLKKIRIKVIQEHENLSRLFQKDKHMFSLNLQGVLGHEDLGKTNQSMLFRHLSAMSVF